MCGIAAIVGSCWTRSQLASMVASQHHRGPDANGLFIDPGGVAGVGHNRLSIIDLSTAGNQPMTSGDGGLTVAFNGEIYNYRELRRELADYPFRSATDTEVILAAYERWGDECLDRFIGMFAFCLWDARRKRLFCARDRFGVKPLHYQQRPDGTLLIASEIKALQAAGAGCEPDVHVWATYLNWGISDHSSATFWRGIDALAPGHALAWQDGQTRTWCWYDLGNRLDQARDPGSVESAQDEYFALLLDSVRLRFRADVPVGITLSGGLDSSTLLGLVQEVQGAEGSVQAFTYVTGDPAYDELPWVREMLAQTRHRSVVCRLNASDVPELARSVQAHEDEPFGGLPTLAYARLFEEARKAGAIVLLDGQGLDEQWAGYDYYGLALAGQTVSTLQGTAASPVRPECLIPEFRRLSDPPREERHFSDPLRNAQYRDIRYTKIPKALRFNDRASMRSSTELREPFLDHRLFELALIQPADRKIRGGVGKWLLRQMAAQLLPTRVVEAPKRAVSTPQREWLRGPLRAWATECIERGLDAYGGVWLDAMAVRSAWARYCEYGGDNSFFVWQWINLGLMVELSGRPASPARESVPA